jgi:hypothetical protein
MTTDHDRWHDYFQKDFGHYDNIPKPHRDALMGYLETLDSTNYTTDDYDIMFAVDDLLADHLDLDDDNVAVQLRYQADTEGLLPSDGMFNDPEMHQTAKELLLLFPLRSKDITAMVDLSYDPEAATAWYYNMAVAILERTDAIHGDCGYGANLRCQYSVQCPRRVVARLLQTDDQDVFESLLTADGEVSVADIKRHVAMEVR